MTLEIPNRPSYFVVDTSSERNVRWHNGSIVYVKDITSLFILDDGSWQTISTGGVSMVYPETGIALSTGSAWGTSITDNSTNWNTAYGWGDHATEGYLTNISGQDLSTADNETSGFITGVDWTEIDGSQSDINLSGFTNDSAFISSIDWSEIGGSQSDINISGFTNDSAFITGVAWGDISGDQSGINLSGFTNDSSFLTTVAYGDLTGNPSDVISAGDNISWDGDTLNVVAGSGDLLADGTVPLTANWDVGDFNLTMNSLTCDGTITDGTASLTGGVLNGLTDINATATTDLALFGTTDVDNASDGKKLTIHRKAAEGDSAFEIYYDQYQLLHFHNDIGLNIWRGSANQVRTLQRDISNNDLVDIVASALYDQYVFGVHDNVGNQFIIANQGSSTKDFDHALQTNPTLYIHSDTDPDSANDEWISLTHDKTNGVIAVGSGGLTIGAYTLPVTDGDADQVLTTNGSGAVTWEDGGSGSGVWTDGSGNIYPTTAADNVTIGGTTNAGTSGEGVLVLEINAEPTTSPANCVQLYPSDVSTGYTENLMTGDLFSMSVATPVNLDKLDEGLYTNVCGDNGHGGVPNSLKFDFGAGNSETLTKISIGGYNVGLTLAPTAFLLQGSNNDSDWTTLETVSGETWSASTPNDYEFENTTAYRYYRMYYTAIGSGDEMKIGWFEGYATSTTSAELKVRDEAGNVTTLSPHNFKNIPKEKKQEIKEESNDLAWAYHSEKDGKSITVDMWSAIRDLEKKTGNKYIYTNIED